MADLTAIQKKLPFKPTALRKARPTLTPSTSTEHDGLPTPAGAGDDSGSGQGEEQDSLALFRRAKEMAPIVEADRERRLRRLQQKQKEQENERMRALTASKHTLVEGDDDDAARTTPPTVTRETSITDNDVIATGEAFSRELVTPPPSKRSRRDSSTTASRRKDVDHKSSTESAPNSPTTRALRSLAPDRSMTSARQSRSLYSSGASMPTHDAGEQTRQGGMVPAGSQVILLDSDSEADIAEADTAASSAAKPVEIIDQSLTLDPDVTADMSEEDDEFAEYVRKAQEQRDQDLLRVEQEAADAALFAPTSPTPPTQPGTATATPIINIVVTSEIPGTRPCLVKFRFDRSLRLVRDNWTALQHRHKVPLRDLLDRDDDVILTWRRKKVYMTSTLLILRILPSATRIGAAVVERSTRDGFNESGTRVVMQAWTPALFAQMEREDEAARRQRDMLDDTAGEGGEDDDQGEDEGEEKSAAAAMVRVVLKSRDRESVKLKVLPETTTDLLVAAFRAQRHVPPEADVALWFDGMRLQEGATMEDADIDDMDTIEVHVK